MRKKTQRFWNNMSVKRRFYLIRVRVRHRQGETSEQTSKFFLLNVRFWKPIKQAHISGEYVKMWTIKWTKHQEDALNACQLYTLNLFIPLWWCSVADFLWRVCCSNKLNMTHVLVKTLCLKIRLNHPKTRCTTLLFLIRLYFNNICFMYKHLCNCSFLPPPQHKQDSPHPHVI